jgi:hypothetical protein
MADLLIILILFGVLLLLAAGIVEGVRAVRRYLNRRFVRARLRELTRQAQLIH